MRIITLLFLTSLGLFSFACSDDKQDKLPAEDYGDIYVANSNSFFLSEKTHEIGWGKSECFMCHNVNNIHLKDRTASKRGNVTYARLKVHENGVKACAGCHGANGISSH